TPSSGMTSAAVACPTGITQALSWRTGSTTSRRWSMPPPWTGSACSAPAAEGRGRSHMRAVIPVGGGEWGSSGPTPGGRVARDPTPQAREEAELLVSLTRVGWGKSNPAFRRVFTTLFLPGGSDAQMAWFDELQRTSCSGEHAARSRAVRYAVDVSDLAR